MHVRLAQPAHEWLYDCRSAALKRHYSRVRIWASVLSVWVGNGGVRLRVDALEGVGCRRACRGHADALATFGSLACNMPG